MYIWIPTCSCTIILRDADMLITCCRVMVVSGLYMLFIQFMLVIFLGYDVPTCGNRVPFIYIGACVFIVHTYDALIMFCLELRMVRLILIIICTIGGRDWPGVRQWRIYMYLLIVSCFGTKSLYSYEVAGCPSNRWTL